MNSAIEQLSAWYQNQCDGKWEHGFGIKIDTIDNPGWSIEIDLIGTQLQHLQFSAQKNHTSETDWYDCWVNENKFLAAGDPSKLSALLEIFLEWSKSKLE
jgi:hypothetical protein